MAFPYIKALHLIFMVAWFAGLFYGVRLFIYHVEAEQKEAGEKEILQRQYKIMEKRLWYIIAWPSMILTVVFGVWMLVEAPMFLAEPWMHLKLAFVAGLVLYHVLCHMIYSQLQKDIIKYSALKLRIWNEVATLFLVAIIFIVVVARVNMLNWIWGVVGLVLLGIVFMIAIKLYKKAREKK